MLYFKLHSAGTDAAITMYGYGISVSVQQAVALGQTLQDHCAVVVQCVAAGALGNKLPCANYVIAVILIHV